MNHLKAPHTTQKTDRPIIGITMGDPAGIGPEIIVSTLEEAGVQAICTPLILGDVKIMEKAVQLKKSVLKVHAASSPADARFRPEILNVLPLSSLALDAVKPGEPSPETGRAMIDYITTAVDLAVSKEIAAMVTAPITKTALKMAHSPFHGHTELIAKRTHTDRYAMMLAGDRLKVILVTIHTALSNVPKLLNRESIVETIEIASRALLNNFGMASPKIAVAGLNPHAGEDNMFGDEEERAILPAVIEAKRRAASRNEPVTIEGPFPPDTLFYHAAQGKYDCVVCMYHDQGLIPFKLIHFSDGVNTTLGLPIIRTSVDHGTAYDIAWQNKADHSSLVQAVKMAVTQSHNI